MGRTIIQRSHIHHECTDVREVPESLRSSVVVVHSKPKLIMDKTVWNLAHCCSQDRQNSKIIVVG
jgi:hypothetical protein